VEAFLERYVDSDGAAAILGVTRITVQQWVRAGRLPAVTGPDIDGSHVYRFEQEELHAWRHERLTAGETQAMLGINRATLHRWVEQGKLTPLEGMGKQRWFARDEVERMVVANIVYNRAKLDT
jgi:excisionase family DNA binding protein